jgi:hypothetical protein
LYRCTPVSSGTATHNRLFEISETSAIEAAPTPSGKASVDQCKPPSSEIESPDSEISHKDVPEAPNRPARACPGTGATEYGMALPGVEGETAVVPQPANAVTLAASSISFPERVKFLITALPPPFECQTCDVRGDRVASASSRGLGAAGPRRLG